MAYYRLYFLTDQSRFSDVVEITCENDEAALERATASAKGRAMELWERSRMVARFDGAGVRLYDEPVARVS